MTAKAKVRIEGENATAAAWRGVMGDAQKTSNKMAGMFKVAFAGISVGMLARAGREAIAFGDDLNKAAIKAGITGKAMSELSYVAKQSDIELSSLSTAIKKMQVSLSEAGTGAKGPTEALAALGLEIKDLKGLAADKQFEILGDRVSKLKDPTDRARAAVELFGKAGADLLPLFAEGAKGIETLRNEAVALGISLNDEQIKALAEADTAVKKLDASWTHFLTKTMAAAGRAGLTDTLNVLSGAVPDEQRIRQLEEKLNLQKIITDAGGGGGFNSEHQEAMKRELAFLRLRQEATIAPQFGGRGGVRGQGSTVPPGFTAGPDKAAEAARKAREAIEKEAEELAAALRQVDRGLNADLDKARDEKMDKFFEDEDRKNQYIKDRAELVREIQDQQADQMSESAQIFRDGFLNAFDDMVNTGKFKWDELLKYMVAEFTRRGIVKLFDTMFNGSSTSSSGGSSVASGIGSFIGSLFGGGRARGGDVQRGKIYEINENTPNSELWAPGMDGTVLTRGALGGRSGAVIYQTNNFPGGSENDKSVTSRLIAEANRRLLDDLERSHRLVPA